MKKVVLVLQERLVKPLFQIAGSPAVIQTQPQSTSGCQGSNVEFEVTASSDDGELQYQWQFYNLEDELWTNLDDNDTYSGTKTEKLTLNSITTSMDGRYRVLVIQNIIYVIPNQIRM